MPDGGLEAAGFEAAIIPRLMGPSDGVCTRGADPS
jgi:hypothetical protein